MRPLVWRQKELVCGTSAGSLKWTEHMEDQIHTTTEHMEYKIHDTETQI